MFYLVALVLKTLGLFHLVVQSTVATCSDDRKVFWNTTYGILSDGPTNYNSNERCEWLIQSPDPHRMPYITLRFLQKDTECAFDYVTIYDGKSYASKVLATLSGDRTNTGLPKLLSKSGYMLVYFFSDSLYERSGFYADFQIHHCPNNCSGNGICLNSVCECSMLWTGDDCSFPACPHRCTNSAHGRCMTQSDKRCTCLNGYIGISCGMHDTGAGLANTWMFVNNSTVNEELVTGRTGHAAVFADSYLWLFGGYDLNEIVDKFVKYDFSENRYEKINVQHAPSPRRYHTMNAFTNGANNYFLLFGGELRNKTFSDELWLYNVSSNSWTRLRGPVPPSLRPVSQHSAAVVATPDDDTYLYVFGGRIRLDGGQFSCDLHRFSWTRQSWEFVSPDPAGLKSSAIRLAGHSMVYDEHAKLLIVFGGFGLSRTLSFRSNSLYFFNIEKNLWYKPSQTGAVPSARAFHSASILGEYMVVHGGNTHTHERDESCHSNGTFFYHLRCHEWHERRAPSDGQRGVFGHASAVAGKNLLLVHGGYDGTARSDLLVYKVPVYAIRDASLSESDKCKSHVTRADCLMNNRCGWCLLPRRTCESKRNSENACSEFSDDDRDRPPCKGLCEKLDQCVACATSERFEMDSSLEWLKRPCSWCVQDRKCYPFDKPTSISLCGNGRTPSGEAWWGLDNSVMANTSLMCIARNVPPGFMVGIYDRQNMSSPVSAFFSRSSLKLGKKPKKYGVYIAKGFMHVPCCSKAPVLQSWLNFMLSVVKAGVGEFYLSSDDQEANLQLMVKVNTTQDRAQKESRNLTQLSGSRYFYKVVFFKEMDSGELDLAWSIRTRGYERHQTIGFGYLEPYRSPPSAAGNCASYRDCYECLIDLACAWCAVLDRCLARQSVADAKRPICRIPGVHPHPRASPYFGFVTDTSSCTSCSDFHTCTECTRNPVCAWGGKVGCIGRYRGGGDSVVSATGCPEPCSHRRTCAECLATGDAGGGLRHETCAWCATTRKCYRFFAHLPDNVLGDCTLWFDETSGCSGSDCANLKTCDQCLSKFECGWCSSASNALMGSCLPGKFVGSRDPGLCPVAPDSAADPGQTQWSYSECPAVDECTAAWPVNTTLRACHPNATCTDTRWSYHCRCDKGYSGDGFECERVCARHCLHGSCSGSPDYRCICQLGWTSDPNQDVDCSVDCSCHFQSTCTTGPGKCDRCRHHTVGERCEACAPGFFKHNRGNGKTLCKACRCNGHGDPGLNLCDAATGVCACLHGTAGDHCDACAPGFYGDPRNGGTCFRQCRGRALLAASSSATGAFGAWDITAYQNDVYCMWIISASPGSKIRLVVQAALDCSADHVFVYNNIPTFDSPPTEHATSICGNRTGNVTLRADSGYVTVVFESSWNRPTQAVTSGFNVTYYIMLPNATNNTSVSDANGGATDEGHCPNNCTSIDHGNCVNGLCRCHDNYLGLDCSVASSKLNKPSFWNLEWDRVPNRPTGAREPPLLYGHCMVTFKNSLWVFGGMSDAGAVASMYRYDLAEKRWAVLASSADAWPPSRHFHACAAATGEQKMLVIGGVITSGKANTLWQFAFESQRWTQLPSDHRVPDVAGHTLTVSFDSVCILIGGYSPTDGLNDKVLAFNARNNSWQVRAQHGPRFPGVFGHSTIFDSTTDSLYVYGGVTYAGSNVVVSSAVRVYNVIHSRWGEVRSSSGSPLNLRNPPQYFHTALYHDDGTHRGFLAVGGRTDTHDVIDDVWLFRFDCHVWSRMTTPLSGSASSVKLLDVKLGYAMAGSSAGNGSSSIHFLFGGNRNGLLLNKLLSLRASSPCYAASDDCECELLRAGCLLCVSNSKSRVAHPACLPNSDRSLELTQCGVLSNEVTGTEIPIVTHSCTPTPPQSFNRCRSETPASRTTHCSDITNCQECVRRVPHTSASPYCKWCRSKCTTDHSRSCVSADQPCEVSCVSAPCSLCSAVSCEQCVQSTKCAWNTSDGATMARQQCVPFPTQGQKPGLLPSEPIPIKTHRAPHVCPRPCRSHTSCQSCLSSRGGGEAGLAGCLWSARLSACFSRLHALLRCADGVCGYLAAPPASSCPSEDCSNVTYCRTCLKQRNCGWMGLADGSGTGECVRGSYAGPAESKVTLAGLGRASWSYISCPPEDECRNGHHDCNSAAPKFDECLDTKEAYECVCIANYSKKRGEDRCTPVCKQGCVRGACVSPGKCQCEFGFTGDDCSVECGCNGLSDCPSLEEKNICLRCINHTHGESCQFCNHGYVGDPAARKLGKPPCQPCSEICNRSSDVCVSRPGQDTFSTDPDAIRSRPGPMSRRDAVCLNCTGHSEGDYCDQCVDGYFMLHGECRKCACNGHGSECDRETGACHCHNATESSDPRCTALAATKPHHCWEYQCDKCKEGYKGTPRDGGQCFRMVRPNQEWCFDPRQQGGCSYQNTDPQLLPVNRSVLFALQPKYTNVDMRVFIDVTEGELDVFLSTSDRVFTVRVDPRTGDHVVGLDRGSFGRKRGPEEPMTTDGSVGTKEPKSAVVRVVRSRKIAAANFNDYVTLDPGEALTVTGVRNRLVVTFGHTGQDLKAILPYVVLLARPVRGGNVTTHGVARHKRAAVAIGAVAARGRLLFRQDQTRIDLFVFFSVFFSCFFLFLSLCIVAWKVKQVFDRQQARIARDIQLQNMASRPFACAYVYLERRVPSLVKKDFSFPAKINASPPTLWDELKTNQTKLRSHPNLPERHTTRNSPGPPQCTDPMDRLPPHSSHIRPASTCTPSHRRPSSDRRAVVSLDPCRISENDYAESGDLCRRPGWPSGQVKKDTMVIHCPPDTHEHSVPLLHSTGAYLTVTTESGEMAYEVVDRSPSPTCSSSKRASFPKSSSRKSMLVRFQRDRSAGGELGVPDPFMSRSVSSPALAKTSGTSSKARGTAGRFAVFRRNRKRPCPVNVGPVAFEPAESLQAGVATVVLQMPAAGNAPSALCLGSTLVCSKSVNYPPSADANSAKSKYRLPLRKLL